LGDGSAGLIDTGNGDRTGEFARGVGDVANSDQREVVAGSCPTTAEVEGESCGIA
jgi:hypothetical protein